MALIRIDKEGIMPINALWRLVLRRIYDPDHAGESDKYLIELNIERWYKKVTEHNKMIVDALGDAAMAQAVGERGTVVDEIEFQISRMCEYLVKEEEGLLEDAPYKDLMSKRAVREHKIDYRKMFPAIYPECRPNKRELARAKEIGRINDLENKDLINNN